MAETNNNMFTIEGLIYGMCVENWHESVFLKKTKVSIAKTNVHIIKGYNTTSFIQGKRFITHSYRHRS